LYRKDVGEYRIIYRFDDAIVYVLLIGKRNDDDVEIEDAFWAANALKAEKNGYVGDNSLNELRDILALKENENTL
jgi:hypothetical protein